MDFDNEKKTFLKKKDKSKKGGVDDNILRLVNLINKHPNYYTTSSCSGRIVLISKKSDMKSDAKWLFVSHDAIDFMDIWKVLDDLPSYDVWFRFEPMILHVRCKEIEDAEDLVKKARELGFKRSGIQSVSKKINVEIAGTDHIDTIVGKKKDLLVDGDYLKILITYANKKMTRNLSKIMKFEKVFSSALKKMKPKKSTSQ